jgi:hypothetical protein
MFPISPTTGLPMEDEDKLEWLATTDGYVRSDSIISLQNRVKTGVNNQWISVPYFFSLRRSEKDRNVYALQVMATDESGNGHWIRHQTLSGNIDDLLPKSNHIMQCIMNHMDFQ